ncbi:uncharacterized protein RB166_021011 [Leptodactylus fuscus]|uniref:uncharacterized protein LOC142186713 n=1 Tax=Leptodactylus fuscus TaxID=238119 RepID=UPI003F4EF475
MVLRLQQAMVRALKKLEEPSFQRFIEKLSLWEARYECKKIPKDELMGKDLKQVTDLIVGYYKHAYGAEVTLAVLEDIGEKKVREELQRDLRKVDVAGHGLGTTMYTDRVNFIDSQKLAVIRTRMDIKSVLRDLQDQDLLTEEQCKDVMDKRTSSEKTRELFDIIRHWEDTRKYTAYTVLLEHKKNIVRDLENKGLWWILPELGLWDTQHFVDRHLHHLISNIKEVSAVIDDLRSNHLLSRRQYKRLQAMTSPTDKMRHLWDVFFFKSDTMKDQFYISLWRYNYTVINNLERTDNFAQYASGTLTLHGGVALEQPGGSSEIRYQDYPIARAQSGGSSEPWDEGYPRDLDLLKFSADLKGLRLKKNLLALDKLKNGDFTSLTAPREVLNDSKVATPNFLASAEHYIRRNGQLLTKDREFLDTVKTTEKDVQSASSDLITNSLGNFRVQNYDLLVEKLLIAFRKLGGNMSVKLHFHHSHLNYFPANLGAMSEEQGERFMILTPWNSDIKADGTQT